MSPRGSASFRRLWWHYPSSPLLFLPGHFEMARKDLPWAGLLRTVGSSSWGRPQQQEGSTQSHTLSCLLTWLVLVMAVELRTMEAPGSCAAQQGAPLSIWLTPDSFPPSLPSSFPFPLKCSSRAGDLCFLSAIQQTLRAPFPYRRQTANSKENSGNRQINLCREEACAGRLPSTFYSSSPGLTRAHALFALKPSVLPFNPCSRPPHSPCPPRPPLSYLL